MSEVIDTLRARLAPSYDVEREIGAGGMARVFLAVEQHPHRRVAIKVLDPELSTRLLRERFIREVDLSSKLSHPHIEERSTSRMNRSRSGPLLEAQPSPYRADLFGRRSRRAELRGE